MYSELANSQSYFVQRKSEHGFKLAMFFWSPPIDFSVGRARKFLNRITKPFHLFFKKMGHSRPHLLYFRLFNTVDSKQINVRFKSLLVCGFELRTSGIGSNRSTNWATTTARINDSIYVNEIKWWMLFFLKNEFCSNFVIKWAILGLFFIYFWPFQRSNQILTTTKCQIWSI